MVVKRIKKDIMLPGTSIILEAGDKIYIKGNKSLKEEDYLSSLLKLGVTRKEAEKALSNCFDDTIESAIAIMKTFKGQFTFSASEEGIYLENAKEGITVEILGEEIEIHTDLESFVFDGFSSVKSAIKQLNRYL